MVNQRLQTDGSDTRSGETAAAYDYRGGGDGTDEEYLVMSGICASCTAAQSGGVHDGTCSAQWWQHIEQPAADGGGAMILHSTYLVYVEQFVNPVQR